MELLKPIADLILKHNQDETILEVLKELTLTLEKDHNKEKKR